MPQVNSFSLHRHPHAPPHLSFTITRRRILPSLTTHRRHFSLIAKHHHHPSGDASSRKLQSTLKSREREALKHYSSLSPTHHGPQILSPNQHGSQILSPNQAVGTVASAQANFMRVVVQSVPLPEPSIDVSSYLLEGSGSSGAVGVELLCVVRAVLKKMKRRVLVGDKVLVGSIDWVDRRGMIENVFPRESEILDPPIANADHFLVLFSMDQPKLEPYNLTRFLVEAESTRIPVTLVLNKCELVGEEVLATWKSRLHEWGYVPMFCSVESKLGLDSLAFTLRERTTVIVGPSGVGKSSLINVLRNNDDPPVMEEGTLFDPVSGSKWFDEQRVGEVSARSGRGKHTTRHVSLLPLAGGGYLADTPGFNQPSLLRVTKHSLSVAFPEIQKMLQENDPKKCAFNNCLHISEPGCVVGSDWERHPYYFQLLDEIKTREEFQHRTMGTKRESDVRTKAGDMGVMKAEPKLEWKKHRRQSRKGINQSILHELDDELDEDESLEDNAIIRAMEQETGYPY